MRVVQTNPKKVYAVDTGLINAFSLTQSDFGHLFENLIFLALRMSNYKIYYYVTKSGYEVDFLTSDIFGKKTLYQVCYSLNDKKTAEREKRALSDAENELHIKGEIITRLNYLEFLASIEVS